MKQTNIYDFLEELEEAARQRKYELEEASCFTEDTEIKKPVPIMEAVITNFLTALPKDELPTLQEAQTIHILDEILSKHNN